MIKIKEAVIVEGKYDKIKLSNILDALIIETNGFHIYKDKERLNFIRKLAEERAARPSSVPAGSSFESERQKQKAALVRQIDELDGSKIRKISAAEE